MKGIYFTNLSVDQRKLSMLVLHKVFTPEFSLIPEFRTGVELANTEIQCQL